MFSKDKVAEDRHKSFHLALKRLIDQHKAQLSPADVLAVLAHESGVIGSVEVAFNRKDEDRTKQCVMENYQIGYDSAIDAIDKFGQDAAFSMLGVCQRLDN